MDFLDLLSRTQIEELILEAKPSLIFVEHDLTFAGKVATSVLDLSHEREELERPIDKS